MNFFEWYGIGIVIILATLSWQAYEDKNTITEAVAQMHDIIIRKADALSTGILLIVALLGPLLLLAIAYFKFREWQDGLAVDEDGNRDYPWSDE